jgi:ribose transport system ATP-binding protein
MTDFLQMHHISKSYGGTVALHDVSFSATAGEVHAISGENGAGKSTLMKILSGAVHPDRGEILLNGGRVHLSSPLDAHRLGIYTVYQEFSLVPHLSITENILLGQMPIKVPGWVDWNAANQRVTNLLDEIGFHNLNPRTPVSRLSVSQQQMVEIAKAAAGKPRILILDEPTAVLSQEESTLLFDFIRKLKEQSVLILYISHRLDELFQIADRITVLKDGQFVSTVQAATSNQADLIKLMVGRTLEEIYPHRQPKQHEEILSLHNFTRQGVFSGVNLSLGRGEILGLFGLVGSGRTELARSIFAADTPTSGEIHIKGKKARFSSPVSAVRAGIAFLTEDRKRNGLVLTASIRDNISLTSMGKMSHLGFLNLRQQKEIVQGKVDELNIRAAGLDQQVWQLSGGNQQKVALAKWLLSRAEILILDEPTRGVDIGAKVEIYQFIHKLAEQGMGILLISSEMLEILGMCDRVLVMLQGRLAGELSRAEASEEKLLALAAGVNQEQQHANLIVH